jgi:nucleotide-binding universal stress UspA family protein
MLNVFDVPPSYYGLFPVHEIARALHKDRAEFKTFLAKELGDIPGLRRLVKHGDVAPTIIEFAKSQNVDLIAMPTHGLGIFRQMVLGSTTAKVLHDAACPVLTGVHRREPPSQASGPIQRILCAVDLPNKSLATMDYTCRFAKVFNAEVRFLHVIPCAETFALSALETEFLADLKERAAEQLTRLCEQSHSTAPSIVRVGPISRTISQEAHDWHADLLVTGRGVLPHGLGRLRTQTYAIIRDAPCPVLSV